MVMEGNIYDKVNDYGSVRITLASPNDIRSWSFGEVRKPETINYRTYRAERDGLFCERIFGPERDWECFCGKYKGTKHKGMICDRCGVKVTHSRVRRKRMGHINLAAPVVHIWFFKAMPSRLGTLLDMKVSDLEKVIYFQDYIVVDAGPTPLKEKQLLTEEEYRSAREKYGAEFDADMGAEAVKKMLQRLDLPQLSVELRDELTKTKSKQKIKNITKRLKLIEALRASGNQAEWMVLDVIPVIPPDLRPLVLLDSGNFATSDLNDLYRRIMNRNNRLKKLVDLNAPEVIIRNEKRMLQAAVDALFDNARCRRPVLGSSNRPLKSLTDMIKGKQGRFRENLLGKRVDYSARSVIVIGPELRLHQCGLPKTIALELFQPFIIRRLKELGYADTIKSAKRMIERQDREVWDILEEVTHQHPVLLNRAPTLHRMGIQAFEPVLIEGNAIKIHPLVCRGFNADFDGDQMAVHLPLSIEAQVDATVLMLSTNNIFSPSNGKPIMSPSQDIVLGCYYLTTMRRGLKGEGKIFRDFQEVIAAHAHGKVALQAPIVVRLPEGKKLAELDGLEKEPENRRIETTVGRIFFNDVLPQGSVGLSGFERVCAIHAVPVDDPGSGSDQEKAGRPRHKPWGEGPFCKFAIPNEEKRGSGVYVLLVDGHFAYCGICKDFNKRFYDYGNIRAENCFEGGPGTTCKVNSLIMQQAYGHSLELYFHKCSEEFMKKEEDRLIEQYDPPWNIRGTTHKIPLHFSKGDLLRAGMPFYNIDMAQKGTAQVISDCHRLLGRVETIPLLDAIKELGFKWATLAGLSFSTEDLRVPVEKKRKILEMTQKEVDRINRAYEAGAITDGERYNQVIDAWTHARELVTAEMMKELENDTRDGRPYLNPIFLMTHSGARGSIDQVRQLAGMRGLMAKPSGLIIETPITANFREGLTVLEYFSSTHGARKGLADTALKTADSGYLTRKLADVAQNSVVGMPDCGTLNSVEKEVWYRGAEVERSLAGSIVGRVAAQSIVDPLSDEYIVKESEIVTEAAADRIEQLGIDRLRVRSPLTCEAPMGCCAKCYGVDLSRGQLVEEGMAVGIIAAESIGEPGTQLTMRTFHIGGTASRAVLQNQYLAPCEGTVKYHGIKLVKEPADFEDKRGKEFVIAEMLKEGKETIRPVRGGCVCLSRNGEILILDDKGRELEKQSVPYGAHIIVDDGHKVKSGQRIMWWDPHMAPILAEDEGVVRYADLVEGETMRLEEDRSGFKRRLVIEHKGELHPRIIIEDAEGKILEFHYIPARTYVEVEEGQKVMPGTLLARRPREAGGTQDITGGLPRVTELFEARKPKEPAVMSEIDGVVELSQEKKRGKMTIIVRNPETEIEKEHYVPHDRHLRVHTGDLVRAGDQLTDGPLVPHDILRIAGEAELQKYMLREVQNVYRSQKQIIDDKHVELILTQMLRKVRVERAGDTAFLPGEVVDKFRFRRENERLAQMVRVADPGDTEFEEGQLVLRSEFEEAAAIAEQGGGQPPKKKRPRPATAKTMLLGVTKASLQSDSFLSAASFQETTKVLTEAALAGRDDPLLGLKENVVLGHLVPAGTGFKAYLGATVRLHAEPPVAAAAPEAAVAVESPGNLSAAVPPADKE
jgi:DNA-directed RNA polymerase beta' subunit